MGSHWSAKASYLPFGARREDWPSVDWTQPTDWALIKTCCTSVEKRQGIYGGLPHRCSAGLGVMGTHDISGFRLQVVRYDNRQHNDRIMINIITR